MAGPRFKLTTPRLQIQCAAYCATEAWLSIFVICWLDNIMSIDVIAKLSRLQLPSVAEQAGLTLTSSQTSGQVFSWCGSFINPYEPLHEKTCFMPYANNKATDQPAHLSSLISIFVVRCLDSITPPVVIFEISRLASLCLRAGQYESYLVANPEDRFSCGAAHMIKHFIAQAVDSSVDLVFFTCVQQDTECCLVQYEDD